MYFNDNETVDAKLKAMKPNSKGYKVTVEVGLLDKDHKERGTR